MTMLEQLRQDGYVMLHAVFSRAQVSQWGIELESALQRDQQHQAAISRRSTIVAARNMLEVFPAAKELWKGTKLHSVLQAALGADMGLMRGLYFDKPPGQSWSLPWHQDRAIAVKDNRLAGNIFGKPTIKAGVPHVEAPWWLSQQILLARIHLDAMVAENGPLQVMPGTQVSEIMPEKHEIVTLHAEPGDVLIMSPLLFHRSGQAALDTKLHRRILHLEFTGCSTLPDGYTWHTFLPG
ncbi:MAG: phytanoyl-CoA dioxygenase family protein [Gemmatales bacterium]